MRPKIINHFCNLKILNIQKGFTLIEITATIVLLAIVLISFFSFFTSGSRFNATNNDRIQAMHEARNQASALPDLSTVASSNANGYFTYSNDNTKCSNTKSVNGYTIETKVNNTAETGGLYPELHQTQIIVKKNNKILSNTYVYYEGSVACQ